MIKNPVVKLFPGLVVLLLSVFLLFWQLGETHLTNWDEAWYADISRAMAQDGDFLTPKWNGQPFLEKPPLFYWLTAVSFRLLGVSEFSARLVSALSSLGTVMLVYWLARKQWGRLAAVLASLVLLSTPAFLWRARTGNLDSLLTLLIFLSATAIILLKDERRWVGVAGFSIGLAFLTKGAVAFLFPVLAMIYFSWAKKRQALKLTMGGIGLGIAIGLVWFVLAYLVNGELFVRQFFAQQGEKIGSLTTLFNHWSLDYFNYLKTGLKLWFVILWPTAYFAFLKWPLRVEMLLLGFIFVFLFIISFFQEKGSWYLHPLYPFLALVIGWSLTQWAGRWRYGKATMLIGVLIISLFQLIRFRVEYFVPDVAADESRVAQASQLFTRPDDVLYLTHYYFPTAVFYSQRKTLAVYSESPSTSWWIRPKNEWPEILAGQRVFINTTRDDFQYLKATFPDVKFEIIFQSGDKLLLKKV